MKKVLLCLLVVLMSGQVKAEPSAIKVDVPNVKFNALLQTWFLTDTSSDFRVRRAELKFSGNVSEQGSFFVMADAAKTLSSTADNKVLQDIGFIYQINDKWNLTVGQFKIPTLLEGLDSSADLPLPERSYVTRAIDDKRETGAQVGYKSGIVAAKVMVSNGTKSNIDDTNTRKDINGRVDVNPITQLTVGGFIGATDMKFADAARWGLNARWKDENWFLRAEWAESDSTTAGKKTRTGGFVADAGYSIIPELQPVVRYEGWYPSLGGVSAKAGTVGLNYFLAKNNQKVQAAFTWMDHMNGGKGSYTPSFTYGNQEVFVLSFQMAI